MKLITFASFLLFKGQILLQLSTTKHQKQWMIWYVVFLIYSLCYHMNYEYFSYHHILLRCLFFISLFSTMTQWSIIYHIWHRCFLMSLSTIFLLFSLHQTFYIILYHSILIFVNYKTYIDLLLNASYRKCFLLFFHSHQFIICHHL